MAKLNLVQQGGRVGVISCWHDPEFRARVRKEHLREVGKIIRLKKTFRCFIKSWKKESTDTSFDFYVLSASPVE